MHAPPTTAPAPRLSREERKVLASTLAGTTIEWYDFFIYAQAAGLVLAPLFIQPLTEDRPGLATIISLSTIGISFLFRPLGAIVAGRFGDRLGRKKMLVLTLLLMGSATALIGLLPTYAGAGVAAPVALIVLRIVQGFSAGGEWGGAALMAVEHAPRGRRGLFGAYPQIGVPVGLILATGVLWLMTTLTTPEQFQAWGWRVPFLASVVLIAVGYLIRRAVEESPVFQEMLRRKRESSAPLRDLFARNAKQVVLTALVFVANNAAGYLVIAYFIGYATTTLHMHRPPVLVAIIVASLGWLAFTSTAARCPTGSGASGRSRSASP
jgi:MFS family permease